MTQTILNSHSKPRLHMYILAVLLAAIVLTPPMALAHAVLVTSNPARDSTVQGPDVPMTFKFNSRLDASKSEVTIVDPSGQSKTLTIDQQKEPDTMTTHATQLKPGKYMIRWQVLSVDGHITRGEIVFEVK